MGQRITADAGQNYVLGEVRRWLITGMVDVVENIDKISRDGGYTVLEVGIGDGQRDEILMAVNIETPQLIDRMTSENSPLRQKCRVSHFSS